MNKTVKTMLTVCALGAMATPAWAQEAGEWVVRAGYWNVAPKSDNGEVVNVDSAASLGFNFTYMVTDNFAVELLAAAPFSHDINLNTGGKVAETKHLPPTLSAQYHVSMSETTSVYAGLGLNYTLFFDEETSPALNNADLELDASFGLSAQVGFDYRFGERYLLNIDARWIDIDTDAELNGAALETVEIDPIVIGINLGMRF